MVDGFLLTAQQVGILFTLMAVGFVCRRMGLFTDAFVKGCVKYQHSIRFIQRVSMLVS